VLNTENLSTRTRMAPTAWKGSTNAFNHA